MNTAKAMRLPINYETSHWTARKAARKQYIREQGGNCHHCGASLEGEPAADIRVKKINRRLFPKTFFSHPVHLHHCHRTGMTIGAVHSHCNAVLWQYHGE